MNNQQETIRNLVNTIYDYQKLRISVGNRVLHLFPELEETQDLDTILKNYNHITGFIEENHLTVRRLFNNYEKYPEFKDNIIKNEQHYMFINNYCNLVKNENASIKILSSTLENVPIYEQYLSKVKGCGTLMSGIIIGYLDIEKASTPSSFTRYVGIDVVNNEGRSMKHTVMVDYTAADGTIKQKKSLAYNPFVKSKLLEVLCGSFLKTKSPYADIFYNAREKYKTKYPDYSDLRIMRMSKRVMLKEFLRELWFNWRVIEGLPICKPYEEALLGKNVDAYDPHICFAKKQSILAEYFKKREEIYKNVTEEDIKKNGFEYYDMNLIKDYSDQVSEEFLLEYSSNLSK